MQWLQIMWINYLTTLEILKIIFLMFQFSIFVKENIESLKIFNWMKWKLTSYLKNMCSNYQGDKIYIGYKWERRKWSPLRKTHQIKVTSDRTNVQANNKLMKAN